MTLGTVEGLSLFNAAPLAFEGYTYAMKAYEKQPPFFKIEINCYR